MSEPIRIPEVYTPLFELIEGHLPNISKVIVTGGRYSGKSHCLGLGLGHAVGHYGHRLLYARYTMTSASQSVIPEFVDKLEVLGLDQHYTINKTTLESNFDKSRVFFKGLKTGSGTQDAALKSLSDVSIFCTEEASEIPTYEEWEKVHLSIRAMDVQPFSVLILNPASTSHWIYKKFFVERGVKAGFNGVKDEVLYIHSTWEDLAEDMITPMHLQNFKEAKKFYESNTLDNLTIPKDVVKWKWYNDVILGGWKNRVDNVIFEAWEMFKEFPDTKPIYHILGLDFGFKDPNVLVETKVYSDSIYCKLHLYKPDLSNQELADKIRSLYIEINGGKALYTVADGARPEIIKELNKLGCTVLKAKKGAGSIEAGIQKILSKDLFIHEDSKELHYELDNYHYVEKTNVLGETKTVPVDDFNHGLDALRYSLSLY